MTTDQVAVSKGDAVPICVHECRDRFNQLLEDFVYLNVDFQQIPLTVKVEICRHMS